MFKLFMQTIQLSVRSVKKTFKSKNGLLYHRGKVHNIIKFTCNLCNKQLDSSSHLTRHIKMVHSKIKPYQCHLCEKGFGEKHELKTHVEAVHQKLKPYICTVCIDKKFSLKSNLKAHIRRYHEGK